MNFDAEKVRKLAEERKKQNERSQGSKLADDSAREAEELKLNENFAALRAQMWASAKCGDVHLGWDDEYLPIKNENQDWLKARGFLVKPVRLRHSYRDWLNEQLPDRKNNLHTFANRLVSDNRFLDYLPDVGSFSLNPLISLSEKIWRTNARQKEPWLEAFRVEVSEIGDKFTWGHTKLLSISNELCELFFEFKRIEQKLLEVEADNEFCVSELLTSGIKISWTDSEVPRHNDFELSASVLNSISTHWQGIVAAIEREMQAQIDSNFDSFSFDITSAEGEVFLAHQEDDKALLNVYSIPLLIEEFKARGFSVVLEWRRAHLEPEESGTESELDQIQKLLRMMEKEYLDLEIHLCIRLNW